jgi:hypothetical protein
MMMNFDATSREVCTVRRVRTNTPLQALNLLNDPVFFEAAQSLANRMVREGGNDPRSRAAYGFRITTARRPSALDLDDLVALYESEKTRIAKEEAADSLLEGLASAPSSDAERNELAAWTMVANVLLNLDETQTKE